MQPQAKSRLKKRVALVGMTTSALLVAIQCTYFFTSPGSVYRFYALIASCIGLIILLAANVLYRHLRKNKATKAHGQPT